MLSEADIVRYSRHVLVPEIGGSGQEKLLRARVAIDLREDLAASSTAAWYLSAAGLGTLVLRADPDRKVTPGDIRCALPLRQSDVGRALIEALSERLQQQNPQLRVERSSDQQCFVLELRGALADSPAAALERGGDAATRLAMQIIQAA